MSSKLKSSRPPLLPSYLKKRFQVLEVIGEGTFGTVFRVYDQQQSGRECALKVATLDNSSNQKLFQMFSDEFRILASLEHPHIARVFDFGIAPLALADEAPSAFFTSEFIRGTPLFDAAADAEPLVLISLVRQITEALVYLSGRKIVHRDLKSSNILVVSEERQPRIKIIDFGVAVELLRNRDPHGAGTLPYTAPEVLRGESYTLRSDLYSLGVIIYYLLNRRFPYESDSIHEMLELQQGGLLPTAPTLASRFKPAFLSSLQRLLALKPEERFFSAAQFLQELNRCYPESNQTVSVLEAAIPKKSFPHLVGRDEELQLLESCFESITRGLPQAKSLVTVFGDLGFGKTKLLKAFKTSVQLQGGCVLEASKESFAHGIQPVFKSWLNSVRSHLEPLSAPAKSSAVNGAWAELIDLADDLQTIGSPGLAILLDDFHDYAPVTRTALNGLFRQLGETRPLPPILLVLSQLPRSHHEVLIPTNDVLTEAETGAIHLRPFNLSEIKKCIAAIDPARESSEDYAVQILRWTGGHPFLVKEALTSDLPAGVVPQTVQEVLLRKVEKLNQTEERLCQLLAVLSEPIGFQEARSLFAMCKSESEIVLSADDLLVTFSRLNDLGILRAEPRGGTVMYRFEHEYLRELLYQRISEAVRIYLHRLIAFYFENRESTLSESRGRIFYHRLKGKDIDKTLALLPDEIKICEADADFLRAISLLEETLAMVESASMFPEGKRIELLRQAARFAQRYGDLSKAIDHLKKAHSSPGFASSLPTTRVGLVLEQAETFQLMLNIKESFACLDEIEAELQQPGFGRDRLRASWIRGRLLYRQGKFADSRDAAAADMEVALSQGCTREAAELLYNRGLALFALGQREPALNDLLQSLTLFNNSGHRERSIYPLNAIALIYQRLGKVNEALTYYIRAYEVGNCYSNNRLLISVAINLATLFHQQQEFSKALEFYGHARLAAERTQQPQELLPILKNLGMLFMHFGHYLRAREDFEKGLRLAEKLGSEEDIAWLHFYLGAIAIAEDVSSEARVHFETTLLKARALSIKRLEISALQGIGTVEIALKRLPQIFASLSEADRLISEHFSSEALMVQHWRWTEYYLKRFQAESRPELLEIALEKVQSAFNLAKDLRHYRYLWMLCELWAELEALANHETRKKELLEKALALAEEHASQIPEEYRHFFLNSKRFKALSQRLETLQKS